MSTTSLPARVSRGVESWLRRNPFENLREEMDQLINQFSTNFDVDVSSDVRLPSLDFCETDKAFEVSVDVPGFKSEEIHVEMQGSTLVIHGEHKEEKEEKNKRYHRVERRSGRIHRSISLPASVDAEKIVAQCRDGVLKVTLPKTEESRSRKIAVKG